MDIVLRAFVAFAFVVVVTRVIGRRELSSLEPFDLILVIVLGDLIQQGVTQSDYSLTGLVLAGGTFTLLTVAVSYLVFRFRRVQPLFEPEPLILVEDGNVIDWNLRRKRPRADELAAEARLQKIPLSQMCAGRCSRRAARSASLPETAGSLSGCGSARSSQPRPRRSSPWGSGIRWWASRTSVTGRLKPPPGRSSPHL
ncbi:MAG: DUF421 domain-containing protein [Gaiellaceae bacterium]